MRPLRALALLAFGLVACPDPVPVLAATVPGLSMVCDADGCGPRGAELVRGPRGGCYYVNRNGNRTYVDRDCCR